MNGAKIEAIVLAAGMSNRMGRKNKLLLPFKDSTIIESTISNLCQSLVHNILVVIGHEDQILRERIEYSFPKVGIVYNSQYKTGQTSSVKMGVEATRKKCPIMIVLGDMPLISSTEYQRIISTFLQVNKLNPSILRPYNKHGVPGNPVLFDGAFKSSLLSNENPESSKTVIQKHYESFVKWETEIKSFFTDIDTEHDYNAMMKKN